MKSSTQRWDKGLYLVPTPIGNLADMSSRAIDAMKVADIILCEDTRVTKKLCVYYGIETKLMPYHDHSDDNTRLKIIEMLSAGKTIALVSDAGTPMISDPGYKLVKSCAQQNIKVIPIPGANAVLPALQLSSFPTDQFYYGGFLPSKQGERQNYLEKNFAKMEDVTQCYYESPKRIVDCLKTISLIAPQRHVAVIREISKLHEEVVRGVADEVIAVFSKRQQVKGEIVLVIAPQESTENALSKANPDLVRIVQKLMETMPMKEVSTCLSAVTSFSKKEIYELGLSLKNEN